MARGQTGSRQPPRADTHAASLVPVGARRGRGHFLRAGIALSAVCAVGVIGIATPGFAQGASAATSSTIGGTLEGAGTAAAFSARGEGTDRGAARTGVDATETAAAARERAASLSEADDQITESQQQAALALRAAGLTATTAQIKAESSRLERQRFVWPTAGDITSPWGPRLHPILKYVRLHGGVDIGGTCGQPIWAAQDGVVTQESSGSQSGKFLRVDHGSINGQKVETAYLHMDSFAVKAGDKVTRGQRLGTVGNTGLSTACHLHFATYVGGTNVDPEKTYLVGQ